MVATPIFFHFGNKKMGVFLLRPPLDKQDKCSNVKVLPKSIGKLKNLETLDLKQSYVTELPVEILELKQLRHLLIYRHEYCGSFESVHGFKAPYKIGGLQFLQKLTFIEASHGNGTTTMKEIGRLTQLRRFAIMGLRREDGVALCSSVGKLSHLRSLGFSAIDEEEILDLQSMSPTFQFLQRLYLKGRLEKIPHWIASIHGLTKIVLLWSKLKDANLMESLQDLPNLVDLQLGKEAYEGNGLCFNAGRFQRLKALWLGSLKRLRWVRVEEGAMPHLEGLFLLSCELVEEIPFGIQHLSNLKSLDLVNMSDRLISKAQAGDHWKIAHIPQVWMGNSKDGNWEGHYL